jgi:hypothetical protein
MLRLLSAGAIRPQQARAAHVHRQSTAIGEGRREINLLQLKN